MCVKKKLSISLLLAVLACGIFSFSNNSYAVTQEKALIDGFHSGWKVMYSGIISKVESS